MNPSQNDPTDPQQPQTPQEPAPTPLASPQVSAPEQPVQPSPVTTTAQTPQPQDPRYAKRVKIVAIVAIVLGALGLLTSLLSLFDEPSNRSGIGFDVVLSIAQVLIGFGLLRFSKIAYIIFNVVAALAVLAGLVTLLGAGFVFLAISFAFAVNPLAAIVSIFGILLSLASSAFCLFAIIWLHPKEVRQLLH